jgi:sugar (pentulose or hexulose) kinase
MSHILIFDIGKTNKKLFVFDEDYRIVFEKSEQLPETTDEDGDSCEDVHLLAHWVRSSFKEVIQLPDFQIKAVNFSGYGASFVYLDEKGEIIAPLYNYLKSYPESLQKQFYEKYDGEEEFARRTASPVLGSLNSGMQLYRLKYEQPAVFQKIKYALHLPQFLSWLIAGQPVSELTSIGCHTNLWDFTKNDYHEWVRREGILEKFPPLAGKLGGNFKLPPNLPPNLTVGAGLHDSSAALIPYLASFDEPFVLLSTGTWSISLNPFNDRPLTAEELQQDCLCYLTREGKPVKASRLFAGHEHDEAVKKIAADFGVEVARISKSGQEGAPGFGTLRFTLIF